MRILGKLLCMLGIHNFVEVESIGVYGCKWYYKCKYCNKRKGE